MDKSIVLEGPDNSGKSTLADVLAKKYGMPVFKAGPPPKSFELTICCCQYQVLWSMDRPCIFDRLTCISQQCYRDMTDHDKSFLDTYYNAMAENIVLIYTCKQYQFTRADYESDLDDDIVRENYWRVRSRYDDLMAKRPHIIYSGDTIQLIKDIRDKL